jgi:hypothetical protein
VALSQKSHVACWLLVNMPSPAKKGTKQTRNDFIVTLTLGSGASAGKSLKVL